MKIKRTERGWAGHFIGAPSCLFRRNTLLECGGIKIVVSTVGLMQHYNKDKGGFMEIGLDRHYETMAFHSDPDDHRYSDANVQRQVYFNSPWSISEADADDHANFMHETVVQEIADRLKSGETFPTDRD